MLNNQFGFLKTYLASYKTFYRFLKVDKHQFAGLFVIILGVASTNTLMIWLLGLPFDYIANEKFSELPQVLLLLFFVILLNQTFHFFNTYRANIVALRFVGRLRTALLTHMINLPYLITDEVKKGDLLTRVSHDVDKVQNYVVAFPLFVASHIFTIFFYCTMLVYLDWQLAIFALVLSSVYLLHHQLFAVKKRRAAEGFYQANGELLAQEDEVLTNSRLISSFNAQEKVHQKHESLFSNAFYWAKKERKINALFSTSLAILIYLCALLIVFQGIHSVEAGALTISGLVSFLLYVGYLSVPLRGVTELIFEAQSDIMAGKRVQSVLAIDKSIHEGMPVLNVTKGNICFEHITCKFGDKSILSNFSVNIPAGKTVAVIGESGSGKSTMVNMLLRFIQPQEGRITLDGTDISQVDIQSLRNNVTIVWQSALLFNDTIKNNLLLAKSDANDGELKIACEQSDAWRFIESLPNGLDTILGTGGVELSAGQKQRIHISQAFLRHSPVLVMDEASSALDSKAEEKIVQALKKNRKNQTTIIIAHRYSSIQHADFVIYLDGNGSATQGTHEELLKNHEAYKKALQWQSALFE